VGTPSSKPSSRASRRFSPPTARTSAAFRSSLRCLPPSPARCCGRSPRTSAPLPQSTSG